MDIIKHLIVSTLEQLDYTSLGNLTFKASWNSAPIEHFIFFERYGSGRRFIQADFGIRYLPAQDFAYKYLMETRPTLYQVGVQQKHPCYISFSLGALDNWSLRWSLDVLEMSESEIRSRIIHTINEKLLPRIRLINNPEDMLSVLIEDSQFVPWDRTGPTIRILQIAFIARESGRPLSEVQTLVESLSSLHSFRLRGQRLDPGQFAAEVISRVSMISGKGD